MEKISLRTDTRLPSRAGSFRRMILLVCTILLSHYALFAQSTIKGKVTDDSNTGIPGVNIVIKGTALGTTTDAEGNYSLEVPNENNQSLLVFSFIGFSTQEISIQGRTIIDVKMAVDAKELSEVVVVGYGTQLKRDITGAIVKVNSEVLQQTAAANVFDQLKGHAAGVDIISASSVPGGPTQIRIRGNRTMTQNSAGNANSVTSTSASNDAATADNADQPLLVVDGIPYNGNLNDISPSDIASMEILKDASATAIYGSRGAGGVILVTTKRGNSGKTLFSYDGYVGFSSVMKELRVFNGAEYYQFKQDAGNGLGTGTYPIAQSEQDNLNAGVSTDWQKLIYQSSPMQNHTLSVSGGNDKSKYSLSGGYFKQGGIIPNQNFTRYTIRNTMDHQVTSRIRVGLNTLNTVSYQNLPGGSGVTSGLMQLSPLASAYNSDGTVNLQPQPGLDASKISPLTLKTKSGSILNSSRRLRTFNSFYGEVDIIKGLKYRANIGLDYSQQKDDYYAGPATWTNNALSQSSSQASTRNTENWQYTVENLLIYDRTFNQKHKIGFTGLYSFQKSHGQANYVAAIGVPFDYMQNTNFYPAQSVNVGGNNDSYLWERGLISYMARLTYSFENRFSATATWRRDGSSVLSVGNQYYSYPAFAAAWNIINEKFMSSLPLITNLKLRAGWGITASQNIDPYSTLGLLGTSAYNFGQGTTGQQVGTTLSNLPNHSLKWQNTAQWNIGLDFGILENRITGAIEYYQQKTSDILLPINLPISNGASSTIINAGKTESRGLELSINSVNVKTESGLTWSTEFNYFFNREKIVALTSGQSYDIANGWFVGQPLSVIYDYKKIGIWQTNDSGLGTQASPTQQPGQIKVLDWNTSGAGLVSNAAGYGVPDNKITPDDRMIIGNFQPKFDAGMTNRVTFKRFDLSISVYARMGMKVVVPYVASEAGGANYTGYNFFNSGRSNQLKVDYWTPTNPTNAFPQPTSVGVPYFGSTLSYVDGSFIKCRNINLGYDIPTAALGKAGITSLHVYASVVNPFVIWAPFVRDHYGPDPEGNGYGGAISSYGSGGQNAVAGRQVTVNANNPATRQFLFGVNLKF